MKNLLMVRIGGKEGVIKKSLLLFCFLLCVSCDVTRPFLINDACSYPVQMPCGKIIFSAYSFGSWESDLVVRLNGEYLIIPQSLNYRFEPEAIEVEKIRIWRNNKEIIDIPDTISINGEEELRFEFRYLYKKEVKMVHGYAEGLQLEILSSDFITCEKEAVINESMKFKIKKELSVQTDL